MALDGEGFRVWAGRPSRHWGFENFSGNESWDASILESHDPTLAGPHVVISVRAAGSSVVGTSRVLASTQATAGRA